MKQPPNATNNSLLSAYIYVDDTPALSVAELRTKAKRMKSDHKIEIIYIDYIRLMLECFPVKVEENKIKKRKERNNIQLLISKLYNIAQELDIPIIGLTPICKYPEIDIRKSNGFCRPQLEDIFSTHFYPFTNSTLDHYIKKVLFIYRPEYYNFSPKKIYPEYPYQGASEIIVAKNTAGSLGTAHVKFIPKQAKFVEF